MRAQPTPPQSSRSTAGEEARWAAVLARDPTCDGQFYYSVATTGVYCRPSCPARRPKRGHVRFHATREAAERAGFRPCKRCKPDQPSLDRQQAEKVAEACRLIETAEDAPKLADLAEAVGLSPYHFHRVFKKVAGVTPKAYASAARNKRVRDRLKRSKTVTEAIYDAGYNSNGRFYASAAQVLGMTPSDFRAGGTNTEIKFAIGQCSLGAILVAASAKGVCAILLGDDAETLAEELRTQFPHAHLIGGDKAFAALVAKVIAFVEAPDDRARPSLGREGDRLSTPGVGRAAANPRRQHGELCGDRAGHRRAEGRACGGGGLRRQPARGRHPLPPRGQERRVALRLSRRRPAEARAAGERGEDFWR